MSNHNHETMMYPIYYVIIYVHYDTIIYDNEYAYLFHYACKNDYTWWCIMIHFILNDASQQHNHDNTSNMMSVLSSMMIIDDDANVYPLVY